MEPVPGTERGNQGAGTWHRKGKSQGRYLAPIGEIMATWSSRGLRGSTLEELINRTNEQYLDRHLALIQKIPTPITPINFDKDTRQITLAYFDQKSTVDYIGAVQGVPVCFDAKECKFDTFSLQNVHQHQVSFMEEFERQDGVAFLLIYYTARDEFYYMPYRDLKKAWDRQEAGGRKSIPFEEIDTSYRIWPNRHGFLLPYLDTIQMDLDSREED